MEVQFERCCGMAPGRATLDVHKETVVACVMISIADNPVQKETQTFGTMTGNLSALMRWLKEKGVTQVALESTGVYWKPHPLRGVSVYNLLEGQFEIMVVNPEHPEEGCSA